MSDFSTDVRGRHVVLRDDEPTLRRDLPRLVRELRARAPASVTVLTNGACSATPRSRPSS